MVDRISHWVGSDGVSGHAGRCLGYAMGHVLRNHRRHLFRVATEPGTGSPTRSKSVWTRKAQSCHYQVTRYNHITIKEKYGKRSKPQEREEEAKGAGKAQI